MNTKSTVGNILGWVFALVLFAMGLVNTFWGNDPLLGVGLLLLTFLYIPPTYRLLKKWTGIAIPTVAMVVLALLLLWVCLGVGELFAKVELMKQDLM